MNSNISKIEHKEMDAFRHDISMVCEKHNVSGFCGYFFADKKNFLGIQNVNSLDILFSSLIMIQSIDLNFSELHNVVKASLKDLHPESFEEENAP